MNMYDLKNFNCKESKKHCELIKEIYSEFKGSNRMAILVHRYQVHLHNMTQYNHILLLVTLIKTHYEIKRFTSLTTLWEISGSFRRSQIKHDIVIAVVSIPAATNVKKSSMMSSIDTLSKLLFPEKIYHKYRFMRKDVSEFVI